MAAWLNQQPDSTGVLTVTRTPAVLEPYLKPGVQLYPPRHDALPDQAGYLVVYARDVQDGAVLPPALRPLLGESRPGAHGGDSWRRVCLDLPGAPQG